MTMTKEKILSGSLDVHTTSGATFSGSDSAKLAAFILRRFGGNVSDAADAWRRMLQNSSIPDHDFQVLAEVGEELLEQS
jgi:hypothetical protein